jgi:hypothetical protein
LLGLAVVSGACGNIRYAYAPVVTTSAEVEGHAAAVAPPPEKGELRVASLGVAEVTPPSTIAGKSFRVLFVRFVVDNQSDEEWLFDQAEQRGANGHPSCAPPSRTTSSSRSESATRAISLASTSSGRCAPREEWSPAAPHSCVTSRRANPPPPLSSR